MRLAEALLALQVALHAPPARRAALAGQVQRMLRPSLAAGCLSHHPGGNAARARLLCLAISCATSLVRLGSVRS